MEIIKRGTVERGVPWTWWLVGSDKKLIARLCGDWVEQYEGQELAIIVLDGQTDASAVWWFETMAKVLNGDDNYVLTAKSKELVSSLIKEENHEMP